MKNRNPTSRFIWLSIGVFVIGFNSLAFGQTFNYTAGATSYDPCAGPNADYVTYYGFATPINSGGNPPTPPTCSFDLGTEGTDFMYKPNDPDAHKPGQVIVRWLKEHSGDVHADFTDGHRENIAANVSMTVEPSISITVNTNNVCPGSSLTFTAHITDAGNDPVVKWYIGSDQNMVQLNGMTFTSTTLQNGNNVYAKVISSSDCASGATKNSAPITAVIKADFPSTFSLTSPQTICNCEGAPVTANLSFPNNSSPTSSTTYTWYVNGQPQHHNDPIPECGPDKVVYIQNSTTMGRNYQYLESPTSPNTVYTVSCAVSYTQSNGCSGYLKSAQTTITVTPPPQFTVGITMTPFRYPAVYCEGEISFQANTNFAADQILWYKNELQVASGATYHPQNIATSDSISVWAHTNTASCVANNETSSALSRSIFTINNSPLGRLTITPTLPVLCAGTKPPNDMNVEASGNIPRATTWTIEQAGGSSIDANGIITWDPSFSGNATVKAHVTGCATNEEDEGVIVTVVPLPILATPLTLKFCEYQPVVLSVENNPESYQLEWFTAQNTSLGSLPRKNIGLLSAGEYTFSVSSTDRFGCRSASRTSVPVLVQNDCDDYLNWIESVAHSKEEIIAHSKQYYDESGKNLQRQDKNLSAGKIFASQELHDLVNRTVGGTLPAPITQNAFQYNYHFVRDDRSSAVFEALNASQPGTLGWYYSVNNNLEEHVPTTSFPYSRVDYYKDGTEVERRSASPGEALRMGSTHEGVSGAFPIYNELDDYVSKRSSVMSGTPGGITTLQNQGVQTLSADENDYEETGGKKLKSYNINIADKNGKTVMSARSGTSTDHMLSVTNIVTGSGNPASEQYRPLIYFYLLDDAAVTIQNVSGPIGSFVARDILNDVAKNVGQTFDQGGKWPAGFYSVQLTNATTVIKLTYTNYYQDVAYQFFDDVGRLVESVTPNGVLLWDNYPAVDKTSFYYDFQGRIISRTSQDAGKSVFKYRKDGKIRFSQNAQQFKNEQDAESNSNSLGKFSYTTYDESLRPIESGEYEGNDIKFSELDSHLEEIKHPAFDLNKKKDWILTFYDQSPDGTLAGLCVNAGLPELYKQQHFTRRAVASTKNANMQTWYSYDERGNVEWTVQKPDKLNMVFVAKYEYSVTGNVLKIANLAFTKKLGLASQFYHRYEYDADLRLSKVFTSTAENGSETIRASYVYYLHGPLKRIVLGNDLQGVDFVYNINGWLTQINHPDKSKDPGGDDNDAFGMIINYYETETDAEALSALDPWRRSLKLHNLPDDSTSESMSLSFLNSNLVDPELSAWRKYSAEKINRSIKIREGKAPIIPSPKKG
ncbi:Ig-like domain-containing protein [Chryseolinea serpens]|nr:hypothetical protein [Chryseolinea serpens]